MKAIKQNYGRYVGSEVRVVVEQCPDEVGTIALNLAEKFGAIAAVPDGEDSSGRSKLRLQTPDELVKRSIDVAEELWRQLKARNHIIDVPLPDIPEPPEESSKL